MVEGDSGSSLDMDPEYEDEINDEDQEGGKEAQREEPKTLGHSAIIAFVVAIIIAIVVLLLQSGNSDPIIGRTGPGIGLLGSGVENLHPCEIISSSELEEILGISISKGAELSIDSPLREMVCRFNSAGEEEPLLYIVIFQSNSFEPFMQVDGYTVSHLFDGNRGAEGDTEVVDDLGDRAYWGGAGDDPWNGLHVLLGDAYINIRFPTGVRIFTQAEAEDIARLLLPEIQ